MMRPRVYLAGPIRNLNYTEATDWRTRACRLLAPDIVGMSPMRGKDYLRDHAAVGQDDLALKDSYDQFPLSTNAAILCRDHRDCTTSDAVIVNFLEARCVSIGTVMEIGWASGARVPIILIMEPNGNVHQHGLLEQACNFRVQTLEAAVSVAKALLLP